MSLRLLSEEQRQETRQSALNEVDHSAVSAFLSLLIILKRKQVQKFLNL
jgi:hypothetical protein